MAESAMKQGMKTWLKKECKDTGMALWGTTIQMENIRSAIGDGPETEDEKLFEIFSSHLKAEQIPHLVEEGYISQGKADDLIRRMDGIIEHFRRGKSRPHKLETLRMMDDLIHEVAIHSLEKTVECQIGRA